MLKAARKREAPPGGTAPVTGVAVGPGEVTPVRRGSLTAGAAAPVVADTARVKPASPAKAPVAAAPAPAPAAKPAPAPARPSANLSFAAPPTPPARKLSTGGEPGISLVSAGRQNTPSSGRGSKAQRRGFFREPQPATGQAAEARDGDRAPLPTPRHGRASPEYKPTSPAFSPATMLLDEPSASVTARAAPEQQQHEEEKQPQPQRARFVPPSKRADLPPRLVVTRVDVEAAGWVPGLGKVVRGTSRDWTEEEADAGGSTAAEGGAVEEAAAVQAEREQEQEHGEAQGAGWLGWPAAEEVERRWDALRPLREGDSAARQGAKVAVKVRLFCFSTSAFTS